MSSHCLQVPSRTCLFDKPVSAWLFRDLTARIGCPGMLQAMIGFLSVGAGVQMAYAVQCIVEL